MPFVEVQVPIYVPLWLYPWLRRLRGTLSSRRTAGLDLSGDRDVETSFIVAHMPYGLGEALDFGCGGSNLSLHAAQQGFRVVALDLQPSAFRWRHPNVSYRQGDLLGLDLPEDHFDLVINCSAVEHVGLAGRYGVTQSDSEGDLKVMFRLRALMRPGGTMLLTIPCGLDAVLGPFARVYGATRLPLLLEGYAVEGESYWVKDNDNRWGQCERDVALAFRPTAHPTNPVLCSYALACFILKKTPGNGSAGGPAG